MIHVLLLFLHVATGIQAQNRERTCELPSDPRNGKVTVLGTQLQEGSIAIYVCDDGKELIGSSVTKCLSSGKWAFPPPICVARSAETACKLPGDPKNGKVMVLNQKLQVGSIAIYVCDDNKELIGSSTSECLSSGEWTFPPPKCVAKFCDPPSKPEHGSVTANNRELNTGTLAIYTCDEGRVLEGPASTMCNDMGEWTNPAPKCIDTCIVPQVNNGQIGVRSSSRILPKSHGDKIESDENVILLCNQGYASATLMGSEAEIICKDGEWSGDFRCLEENSCGDPPHLENAVIVTRGKNHEDVARYRCLENFRRTKRGNVTCLFGTWVGVQPICTKTTCIVPQVNNGRTGVRNSSGFFPKSHGDQIVSDEDVILLCNKGYASATSKRSEAAITCKDGEWSAEFQCLKEYPCGEPPHLENAVIFTRGRNHGDVTRYRCLRNFRRTKRGNVTCLFGSWVGVQPTCADTRCYIDDLKYDGLVKGLKMVYHSSENFTPSCQEGYRLSNTHQNEIKCQDGEWRGHFPPCVQIIQCPKIDESEGLTISYTNELKVDSVAEFHCVPPYVMMGSSKSECRTDGTWQNSAPVCQLTQCPIIIESERLVISYTNELKVGSMAVFHCLPPYVMLGRSRTECRTDGTWQNRAPICQLFRCPKINESEGLTISYTNELNVGSIAVFHCLPPYVMLGRSGTECRTDGKWQNTAPVCQLIRCPKIAESEGLTISYTNELKVGSVAEFHCVPPYVMIGSSRIECRTNGTWESTAPSCQDTAPISSGCSLDFMSQFLPQHVVPDVRNGPRDKVPFKSSVVLTCDETNMHLVGIPRATCRQNGVWDFGDMQCIRGCSSVKDATSVQLLMAPERDFYSLGDTVELYCPKGYALSKNVFLMICMGQRWSENVIPKCLPLRRG